MTGRPQRPAAGLYLHLPFCASHCAYCTFATSTEIELLPRTIAVLCAELATIGRRGGRRLASLYLGGGTPSLVPPKELREVFATVRGAFPLLPTVEVTLEANPDDVTPEKVALWRELGVTRVSLGVQAFVDEVLAMLNRRHDAAQSLAAARLVREAGLTLSIDLMLGLPAMTRDDLARTLRATLELMPEHVSVYLLEMDKPHALAQLHTRRPDLFPSADAAASQYLAVGRVLVGAGYHHYEISNFALPGFVARHNVRYWTGRPVLTAGLAAHGQCGAQRWANVAELPEYLAAVESGANARAWSRALGADEALKESVMLGLRMARGVDDAVLHACAERSTAFSETLADFQRLGLVRAVRGRTRLTPRGWLVSNELFAALW